MGLTKRNNAQLVKFNENMWSRHPLNMTGFHNASQAASTVSVHGARESVQHGATLKKDQKRFQVCMRHGAKHGIKKMAANSCSGGERSTLSSGPSTPPTEPSRVSSSRLTPPEEMPSDASNVFPTPADLPFPEPPPRPPRKNER